MALSTRTTTRRLRRPSIGGRSIRVDDPVAAGRRRIAANFACLSAAEVACRATSVVVALTLARRLGEVGLGRIEFAFNVVFWLVLIVRDGLEVIASREIARHPSLVRPLVNHVLAIKLLVASGLLAGLVFGSIGLGSAVDRGVLCLYGLLLMTTALGLDFVFRGLERMGLVAISLIVRTAIYAVGVAVFVVDPRGIAWVPTFLVLGEAVGIGLVWCCYARRFGVPRPSIGGHRLVQVLLERGRPVYLIQVSQAVLGAVDLLVVAFLSGYGEVGRYAAPHRMVTAFLTFGLIVQQVVFPSLSRSWRDSSRSGREALDRLVRVLVAGMVPIAVGGSILAGPLSRGLFPRDYRDIDVLLMIGIWRAPLLTVAFLYQSALIALNREAIGVRLLMIGAVGSVPLVAASRVVLGLPGAAGAMVGIGLGLVVAGHWQLGKFDRQPAWHHHLARPLLASAVMAPACLFLAGRHVGLGIAGGAVVYVVSLAMLGGLGREDWAIVMRREACVVES